MLVACEQGHLSVCEWLNEMGAAADITKDDNNGWTPMYVACKNGHLSICKWLILNGILTDDEHKNVKYTFLNGQPKWLRLILDL